MKDETLQNCQKRAEQLYKNCKWLITQMDIIHSILCPNEDGGWIRRVEQAVEAVKRLKK